jgi:hypothetical protein
MDATLPFGPGDGPTDLSTPEFAARPAGAGGRPPRTRLRWVVYSVVLALLPVTAGIAFVVLHVMGSAAAGATGGCGGG